jgi:hypothetical protein
MNRPINFIVDESDNHPTYDNVNVTNLNNVINGYLPNIVCDCLDKIPFSARHGIFFEIINKLAYNGEAVFKMINGTIMSNRIQKNEISCDKLSEIIDPIKSIWTDYLINDLFNQLPNIKIQKYYHENVYTIISVVKTHE